MKPRLDQHFTRQATWMGEWLIAWKCTMEFVNHQFMNREIDHPSFWIPSCTCNTSQGKVTCTFTCDSNDKQVCTLWMPSLYRSKISRDQNVCLRVNVYEIYNYMAHQLQKMVEFCQSQSKCDSLTCSCLKVHDHANCYTQPLVYQVTS